ncbi:hypothetical protein [Gymnodinialimonas hymeniacidonis]|uniref:hypothetical protein n=1 Tax=Gymnodinialimonas hymeniacidonis TaxID=3126508 RepID=UPI0034C6C0B6
MAKVVRIGLTALFALFFCLSLFGAYVNWPLIPWDLMLAWGAMAGLLLARSWIAIPAFIGVLVATFDDLMLLIYATQPSDGATVFILLLCVAPLFLISWLAGCGELPRPTLRRHG